MPASLSEQAGSCHFSLCRGDGEQRRQARGEPAPVGSDCSGGRARGRAPADTTPLATPAASVVLTSLSRVPPRVTSFRTVPGQGRGPDVSPRTCISKSCLSCCIGRDVPKTASHKSSVFLCTGGILMNSSFILIFVQPTEASFSNVFHSHPPQKRKKYYL